jgi:hypothetical protein
VLGGGEEAVAEEGGAAVASFMADKVRAIVLSNVLSRCLSLSVSVGEEDMEACRESSSACRRTFSPTRSSIKSVL